MACFGERSSGSYNFLGGGRRKEKEGWDKVRKNSLPPRPFQTPLV
jgi:hypothetical protein